MTAAARTAEMPPVLAGIEQLDDDRLALAVRTQGERAFELLYDRLSGPVYGYCCGILGDNGEAEEALQETMIRAYSHLQAGDAELRIKPWLYTVARNVCIDRIRRTSRITPMEIDAERMDLLAPSAAEAAEERDRLRMLVSDMSELSERQRSALILRELSGVSLVEIGEILATTPDRAKALISEGRRKLRKDSSLLQVGLPALSVARGKAILANVLASGTGPAAAGGAGVLAAIGGAKLATVAAVVAIGAGAGALAISSNSGDTRGGAHAERAAAFAAAAAVPGTASAVRSGTASAIAAANAAGPSGSAGGGGGAAGSQGAGSGGGAGSGAAGALAGANGTVGTVTGTAQGTVGGVLGSVDQTAGQVQGTVNGTVQGTTQGAGGTVNGVGGKLGVNVPDLNHATHGVLGK